MGKKDIFSVEQSVGEEQASTWRRMGGDGIKREEDMVKQDEDARFLQKAEAEKEDHLGRMRKTEKKGNRWLKGRKDAQRKLNNGDAEPLSFPDE